MLLTHPFAVDGHLRVRVDTKVGDLRNILHTFHIRRITTSAEDASNARLGIHVVGSDQCAGGVTCEGNDLCGDGLSWGERQCPNVSDKVTSGLRISREISGTSRRRRSLRCWEPQILSSNELARRGRYGLV